jgi:hypothetical protein
MSDFMLPIGTEDVLEARILRCACGDPGSHQGEPCPTPRVEELGVISRKVAHPRPAPERGANMKGVESD